MIAHAQSPYIDAREYLERERAAARKSEYWDGAIVAMAGAQPEHNALVFDITAMLGAQMQAHPCQGFGSDQMLRVDEANRYFYPDITVVCGPPEFEDHHGLRVLKNPALIIEVLSPSTERADRVEKFDSYRTIPTLTTYVLVAHDQARVECLTRQPDGSWRYEIALGTAETIRLDAIGCSLPLAAIYARVPFPAEARSADPLAP